MATDTQESSPSTEGEPQSPSSPDDAGAGSEHPEPGGPPQDGGGDKSPGESETSPSAPSDSGSEEETTPAQSKAEDEEREQFAQRFAALSRKERKLFEKQQAIKAQEADVVPMREAKALLSKDPIAALEKLGIDPQALYSSMTRKYLDKDDAPSEHVSQLQARIDQLERSLQERDQASQAEQAKSHIRAFVAESPDKYTFIAAKNAHELVLEVMNQGFQQGRVLTLEEASDMVEQHFENEATEYEKVKAKKTGSKQETSAQAQEKPSKDSSAATRPKTLSNKHTQTAPPAEDDDAGPVDIDDRIEWLIKKRGTGMKAASA